MPLKAKLFSGGEKGRQSPYTAASDSGIQRIQNSNPDQSVKDMNNDGGPMARPIGKVNDPKVLVDDKECWAPIDSSSQLSTITVSFVHKLGTQIHQLT